MGGGSIEKLSAMMGHSSTLVTQRYAHLRPELFTAETSATWTSTSARAIG
jgi:hypothetical protein